MKNNFKKLKDICEDVSRVKPSDIYDGDFIYIDISSVDPNIKKVKNPKKLNPSDAPGRARQLVRIGDSVFATTRPYLENIAFIDESLDGAIASTGFCVISPKKDICDPEYIFKIVSSKDFIEKVLVRQKGASYPAVSDEDILNMEIPLPPLDEQRRIVARLERDLGKIVEAKRLRAEAITSVESLLPAELHKIFEEGKAKGWEEKAFTDVLDIQGGSQPPKSHFESSPKDGYVRLYQIRDLGGKDVPVYVPRDEVSKFMTEHDILIGRYGASIGKIFQGREGAYNVALAKVIFDKKRFEKDFVFYYLQSELFQKSILQIARSAQAGFNKSDLSRIKIYFPPLAEQKEIVARVDALVERINTLRARQKESAKELEALEKSILAKAFDM